MSAWRVGEHWEGNILYYKMKVWKPPLRSASALSQSVSDRWKLSAIPVSFPRYQAALRTLNSRRNVTFCSRYLFKFLDDLCSGESCEVDCIMQGRFSFNIRLTFLLGSYIVRTFLWIATSRTALEAINAAVSFCTLSSRIGLIKCHKRL